MAKMNENINVLNETEAKLLELIRSKKYRRLNIKFNNQGDMDMIEATEALEKDSRIINILKEYGYQNIEIKQDGGKISLINRTVKLKFTT